MKKDDKYLNKTINSQHLYLMSPHLCSHRLTDTGKKRCESDRCLVKAWQVFLYKCLEGATGANVTAVILERNSKEEVG